MVLRIQPLILLLAQLMPTALAHVVMYEPAPFPAAVLNPAPMTVDVFPCNLGSNFSYTFTNSTSVAAGSSLPVNFKGSALHGGGSCQFALSAKPGSTDPQDWKVIMTAIGGCPGTVGAGNLVQTSGYGTEGSSGLPDGPHCSTAGANETDCVRTYTIAIPKEVPSGSYTFAWTWFNKIGNREMYMGCAPLSITGGGTNSSYMDSLPSIFVANIDGYCTTVENDDGVLAIPNPGLNVEVSDNFHDMIGTNVIGTCPTDKNAPANGGPGGMIKTPATYYMFTNTPPQTPGTNATGIAETVGISTNANSIPTNTASPPTYMTAPTATVIITVYASMDANPSIASSSTVASAAIASPITYSSSTAPTIGASIPAASASAEVSKPASATPSGNLTTGNCAAGQLACPTGTADGTLVCVSTTQFALCNSGCLVPMAVAEGTICQNGQIMAGS